MSNQETKTTLTLTIEDEDQLHELIESGRFCAITSIQRLRPTARCSRVVLRPPTYAGEEGAKTKSAYALWNSPDGRQSVILDKPASQANRVEPVFKRPPYRSLVPEVKVEVLGQQVDLLDVTHRIGDASVLSSLQWEAIEAMLRKFDRGQIADLARAYPTSVLLGAWNSRGGFRVQIRRLWGAKVMAYGVTPAKEGTSVHPAFDYQEVAERLDQKKSPGGNEERSTTEAMQAKGLKSFSSTTGILGGVECDEDTILVRESSFRINRLHAWLADAVGTAHEQETRAAVRYLFGLGLIMETMPPQTDLREGCHLVAAEPHEMFLTAAGAGPEGDVRLNLTHEAAIAYCERAASMLGIVDKPQAVKFDPDKAFEVLAEEKKKKQAGQKGE